LAELIVAVLTKLHDHVTHSAYSDCRKTWAFSLLPLQLPIALKCLILGIVDVVITGVIIIITILIVIVVVIIIYIVFSKMRKFGFSLLSLI
jgi:hypothetical protein